MPKISDFVDPQKIELWIGHSIEWIHLNILAVDSLLQAMVVLVAFLISWFLASRLQGPLTRGRRSIWYNRYGAPVVLALAPLSLPVIWLILQWFSIFAAQYSKWPHHIIEITVSLLTAWVVIRLAATLIRDPQWSRVITVSAWVIAALNITNLLDPTQAILGDMGMEVGDAYISVLSVIKAGIALAILLWLASLLAALMERRLTAMPSLTRSSQVLFAKLFRIAVFAFAVVVGLNSVGIDLTAFAVFSGAVGLGVGFGLQKVIANLISGIILLMDKSVKPGDVIALGATYGEIKTLGARYVSVITRDGVEHLIPNEELISQRVENWSFSDEKLRVRIPIGISYTSDLHLAIALALQVAEHTERVLVDPKPVCQLKDFGDSAVIIELRIWVNDPENGLGNVRSKVLLGIWDIFHENNIEFPYPQRDIHIRSMPEAAALPVAQAVRPEVED